MPKQDIPRKAIYRLSLYYRNLQRLKQNEVETVSSATLAKASGVKPTQLRKDLTYIGQFGRRGLGYTVSELCEKLSAKIGRRTLQAVALIGVGQLGSALLRYEGFAKEGFDIVVAFDIDPGKVRKISGHLGVRPISELSSVISQAKIKMAILCVPAIVAQEMTNQLVAAGIQAILNFCPAILQVSEKIFVNNVDLAIELENLSYFIR